MYGKYNDVYIYKSGPVSHAPMPSLTFIQIITPYKYASQQVYHFYIAYKDALLI